MNYRSIAPAIAIGALLSVSACNDPATEPTDDYEMGAEETQPVIDDMGDVQDLPPPETQNLPATPPVIDPTEPEVGEATAADPATDVDPAIEPVDPVAE